MQRRPHNIPLPKVDPVPLVPNSNPIPFVVAPAVMPGGYEQVPGVQVGLPILGDVQQGVPVYNEGSAHPTANGCN